MNVSIVTRRVTASTAFDAIQALRACPGVVLVRHATDMHDGTFQCVVDLAHASTEVPA